MRKELLIVGMITLVSLVGCAQKEVNTVNVETEVLSTEDIQESTEDIQESTEVTQESTEVEKESTVKATDAIQIPETEYAEDIDYVVTFGSILDTEEQKEFASKLVEDTNVPKYRNYLNEVLEKTLSLNGIIKDKSSADIIIFGDHYYERVVRYTSYEKVTKQSDGSWKGKRYLESNTSEDILLDRDDTNGFGYYLVLSDTEFEVIGGSSDKVVCAYRSNSNSGYMTFIINDDTISEIEITSDNSFTDDKPSVIAYTVDLEDSDGYNEKLDKFNTYKKGIEVPKEG